METPTPPARSLRNVCNLFLKDLEALPEEAFTEKFGPKVRTIADIVYEVNLVNEHIGLELREEPLKTWPEGGWIVAPEGFRDKQTVIDAFKASSEKIAATADSFSPGQMEALVKTEEGSEESRSGKIRFITIHLWYHLGQLNFVQTLLGDDAWHWG